MSKVYLSSTVLDLKDERDAVTRWLIAAGHQPVHSYVADSETVRESCLADIERCGLYVLILGHRFGFVPESDNPEGLSITQIEFRRAGELELPRVVLKRTSVPDVRLSDLLDRERNRLLQAFHDEVGKAVRPAEFADEAGLIATLSTAIQRASGKDPDLEQVLRMLIKRDAEARNQEQRAESLSQRVAELEQELERIRASAVNRVLQLASKPDADRFRVHWAQGSREALSRGDSALAELFLLMLLREKEEGEAIEDYRTHRMSCMGEGTRISKFNRLRDVASVNLRKPPNPREAAELAREIAALAIGRNRRAALAALERAARYQPEDFWTWAQLGDAQAVLGQSAPAMASYKAAHVIAEALAARDPANSQWQRYLSVSHQRIGDVLQAQCDGPGALAAYRLSLGIHEALAAHDPANAEWQRDLIVSHVKLSEASGDSAHLLAALQIAERMQKRGILAPRDARMIEELRRRAGQ